MLESRKLFDVYELSSLQREARDTVEIYLLFDAPEEEPDYRPRFISGNCHLIDGVNGRSEQRLTTDDVQPPFPYTLSESDRVTETRSCCLTDDLISLGSFEAGGRRIDYIFRWVLECK